MKESFDVVVVGAGPVGLLLAIELVTGGASVLVLERLEAVNSALKALGIGPLGVEALRRRGMTVALRKVEAGILDAMERGGSPARGRMGKFGGHFGGLFLRRDALSEPDRRMCAVDQQNLEAVLGDRARVLGVEVRRGCDVTGFVQGADDVEVQFASASGPGRVHCAYLVGCDGGRSPVRKLAGFAFPGTPPTLTMYQAVVELDRPELLLPAGWNRTTEGVFSYGAFPNRLFMVDFSGPPKDRQAPVTREEVEGVVQRLSGTAVCVATLHVGNRWTDNTRLVDTYRQGRVLLAGDAAHVHSPFGGQGLSLGLVDAANLGWKLAAVVRGDLSENLLDTYTAERRPVAAAVLANTQAQTALLRPDPQSGALREIMAKLMEIDEVNRSLGDMMRGLSVRHDLGSDHDEVGRLLPDRPLSNGEHADSSLYDHLQDGCGLLLDATSNQEASGVVATTAPAVRCLAVEAGPSMLIRPDACVAWISTEDSTAGLEEALRRWFAPALDTTHFPPAPSAKLCVSAPLR